MDRGRRRYLAGELLALDTTVGVVGVTAGRGRAHGRRPRLLEVTEAAARLIADFQVYSVTVSGRDFVRLTFEAFEGRAALVARFVRVFGQILRLVLCA